MSGLRESALRAQTRGTSADWLATILTVALVLLLLVVAFAIHQYWLIPNHDNEWYLISTERMLHGGRYITDYMEPNPPLIMLLVALPVAVADWLGLPPYPAFISFVCLLIGLSIALTIPAMRWLFRRDMATGYAALVCYAAILCLYSSYQFGQREHLAIVLLCPGLFWYSSRDEGARYPKAIPTVAMLLASLGVLIKPFYLFLALGLVLHRAVRYRTWRVFRDWAAMVVLVTTLIYGAVIILAFPQYFLEADIQRQVYFGWDRSWTTVLLASRDAITTLVLFVLLTELAPLSSGYRQFFRSICLASLVCIALGIAQKKGWPYQLLPSVILSLSGIAFELLYLGGRLAASPGRLAALAAIFLQLGFLVFEPWNEMNAMSRTQISQVPLIANLQQMAKGKSVLLMTSGFQQGFPGMANVILAGRAPSQILLPGIVKLEHGRKNQQDRAAELKRLAVQELVEDIQRYQPDFIAVDQRQVKQALPDNFDLLHFYSGDPAFEQAWQHYRLARAIPGWAIYGK